jgi:hypothetical protein
MGIEIVSQFVTSCKLALQLGQIDPALDALVKLADLLFKEKEIVSPENFKDELTDIALFKGSIPSHAASISGLIHLILWKKFNDKNSGENLLRYYHPEADYKQEVIILAGKGGILSQKQKKAWTPWLHQILSGFTGTVVSGGTDSGIPGLTGEIAAEWIKQDKKRFQLLGYLPGKLTEGIDRSPGYDQFITSRTDDFSKEDVLNYWVDILFRGIPPERIMLAGISGGRLSLFEYKLALAMGVKVALLKDSRGSVGEILEDPYWSAQQNLSIVADRFVV